MIILLSPAKTLDMDATHSITPTQPALLAESKKLITATRKYSVKDLQQLMSISEKLAALNHARFKAFKTPFTQQNATPAGFAFHGDVYAGLQFASLSLKDQAHAQAHLRILSGLYGLLRPFDLMQAYRLEMGIKLTNPRGKTLYDFWGDRITTAINEAIKDSKSKQVINLASNEYFHAVNPKLLAAPLITPIFKEKKGKDYKVVSFQAKKARGRMAAWLIESRAKTAGDILPFDRDGYQYNEKLSTPTTLTFTRG